MIIRKECKNEIVVCETLPNYRIFIKKYYNLDGSYRKEKLVDINTVKICGRFPQSAEQYLRHLVREQQYEYIT